MTGQIEAQRDELVEANRQLDERRRFTEAVLAGVASGVIGLDADGNLNLPNRTGSELLDIDLHAHVGRSEEHTSELQSLMRISYAVFCFKKKKTTRNNNK